MCWQAKLQQTLTRIRASNARPRIVILGVGQELRGDDALGVVAVRKITRELSDPAGNVTGNQAGSPVDLICIDAGPVPENFCSQLRDFQPDLLLVIDAARLEQTPGTIAWIQGSEVDDSCFSTHSLPLSLILGYLAAEAGCEAAILGIQPVDLSFGAPLSAEVSLAVDTLLCGLLAAFRSQSDPLNRSAVSIAGMRLGRSG